MTQRRRLDLELVRRGIAPTRAHAQRLIEEGKVLVAGATATNSARQVSTGEPVRLVGPRPKFVSRGGEKLSAALTTFDIDVNGKRAIDVGASTGGFTDCLLQSGASHVVALDVGHGQLHERIRGDDRVDVRERVNVRHVTPADFDGAGFDVVTCDVSFISLRTIAPALCGLASPMADMVALIKPQFEAGRQEVSKGKGVVGGREIWHTVLISVVSAMEGAGAATMGVMTSPILGAEGNVEFLGWFRAGASSESAVDIEAAIDEAEALTGGND